LTTLKNINDIRLAVIGLGYVGLPLAVEFGKVRSVIGFDIDQNRINKLNQNIDDTQEVSNLELTESSGSLFSAEPDVLIDANVYLVTVPTPIDAFKRPDLNPLFRASETIGTYLKRGDIVVYESTVYPGCIEEDCVPVLEKVSGLKFNVDFFAGYSPERINPGDKEHRLINIKKVTSGSTPLVADLVDELYRSIILAGTYKASSIKVAEAAKVIENTQRDVNIALINELAMIFNRMDIDTYDVLAAAATKWNFLPFLPGLVGGHCIGVDPYYLTHKAQSLGYHPEIVLAGRRVNDGMGKYVARQVILEMSKAGSVILNAKVLVLGLTFKENCPDLRNSKVIDVIAELQEYGADVDVYDPWVSSNDADSYFGVDLVEPNDQKYSAMIFAVAHEKFINDGEMLVSKHSEKNCVIYDLKRVLPEHINTTSL